MLVAQVALAVAYGVLRWPVVPAVLFSFAASVVPAYALSQRWVWGTAQSRDPNPAEAAKFVTVAFVGACTAIVIVWTAVTVARLATDDHLTLSVVANAASLFATGIVWVARYYVLNRYVFGAGVFQTSPDAPRGRR
jgi:putative flippase GtrA